MVNVFKLPNANLFLTTIFALFLLGSCVDSDYDLSNIDATVGINSDTLSLPSDNNTQDITLNDVFDLSFTEFVDIDENGFYYVKAESLTPYGVNSAIAKIFSTDYDYHTSEFTFTREDLSFGSSKRAKGINNDIAAHFTGTIGNFELNIDNVPQTIEGLKYVSITSKIRTYVSFSNNFKRGIKNISSVKLHFPQFMDVENVMVGETVINVDDDNNAVIYNISPQTETEISLIVKGLDFTKQSSDGGVLKFVKGEGIQMKGTITATGTVRQSDVDLSELHANDVYTITGKVLLGTIVITGAEGYFSPKYKIDYIGKAVLGSLPVFLDDDNVVLDLSEIYLNLDVENTIPFPLLASGNIVGTTIDGDVISKVPISQFRVPANKKTVICFCNSPRQTVSDTIMVEVPHLSDLLKKIPDIISVSDLEVAADASQLSEMVFGETYSFMASFSLYAPLSFGSDACIVYKHPYTGWNKITKDISFVTDEQGHPDGSYLISADIENKMPFHLDMQVYGLDANGDSISSEKLKVEVLNRIPASPDGVTPVNVHQQIVVRADDNEVYKQLDGIMLKIVGRAKDENGENPIVGHKLNFKNQTINIKNIKMQLIGQLAIDCN